MTNDYTGIDTELRQRTYDMICIHCIYSIECYPYANRTSVRGGRAWYKGDFTHVSIFEDRERTPAL